MISYDISNDRHRREVELCLQRYGNRVQKSVFECLLKSVQLEELRQELSQLINSETDSLRYYPLCARCQDSIKWLGIGDAPDNAAWYIY